VQLHTAINPVNDRPVIPDATLASVPEDTLNPPGNSVLALFEFGTIDPDGGNTISGIVVIGDASVAAQGQWEYLENYTTWVPVGTVTPTQGLVLDRYTDVRFVPATNFNGTPGSLTVYGVSPFNDAPSAINAVAPLIIDENSSGGSAVGTVIGVDTDGDALTYSLLNNAGGRFNIDSNTGDIVVANGAVLNFESSASHVIEVQVTDTSMLSFNQTFTVTVNDINESPSFTSPVMLPAINEDDVNPAGARVGDIFQPVFSDPDTGQTLTAIAVAQDNSGATGQWERRENGDTVWYGISPVSPPAAFVLGAR